METIRFDYLKTFLTVARTHSFSTAAKELRNKPRHSKPPHSSIRRIL